MAPKLHKNELPSVMLTNCRSLNDEGKLKHLKKYATHYMPDVIMVTETNLLYPDKALLEGYEFFHCGRNEGEHAGGGAGIYISGNIFVYPNGRRKERKNNTMYSVWLTCRLNPDNIYIGVYYHSNPNIGAADTREHIENKLSHIFTSNCNARIIIGGDWNQLAGLENILNGYGLRQVSKKATRVGNCLDVIFTNQENYTAPGCKILNGLCEKFGMPDCTASDHKVVYHPRC